MNAISSFFQALANFFYPPTTTVKATVVGKQFVVVPLERPLFSDDNINQPPVLIEVPMLTVTLAGVAGSREIRVPLDFYHEAIIGQAVEVEIRPSRIVPEYTHVDYSHAF